MKKWSIVFTLILSVLFFASTGLSQQTGNIKGDVSDDVGNGLPGVTVTLTSPALQGTKSYISTQYGNFRFPALSPGVYSIKFELPGFQTLERPGIQVSLGATTTVVIMMTPTTLDEEVTVTAPSPVVDVEASDISVTYTKEALANLPARRDILDIYQSAPATVGRGASNDYQKYASVAGGALHDSKISIDGVDLVDISRGYISADVNYDAIEEVEMTIGGHKAETGQVAAGFLNVVTKSGGNEFSGSLMAGYTDKGLAEVVVPQESIDAFGLTQPQIKDYKYDVGANIGGPIFKDKLWFFASLRYAAFEQSTFFIPFTDPEGYYHPAYPNTRDDIVGLGKITWQITDNLKWFGMYQYNKGEEYPEMWSVTKQFSALESQKIYVDDSTTISSVMTFVLNQNSFFEGRFGYVDRVMSLPFSGEWVGPVNRGSHIDRTTQYEWGMADSNVYDYIRKMWNAGLNFTNFQDGFLGADHEFKAGFEYASGSADRQGVRPNPYFYQWNNGEPWYYSDSEAYKGRFAVYNGAVENLRPHMASMYRMSAFIQDTFNIGERMNVNLGFRYDYSNGSVPAKRYEGWDDVWENGLVNTILPEIFQPAGSVLESPPIDDIMTYSFLSPRVGVTYDLFGNGKTLLKAAYSVYGETMFVTTLEALIPLQDRTVTFDWWDDNKNGRFDLPPTDRYVPGGYQLMDTDVEPLRAKVAGNISSPYTTEITAGVVQEVGRDFSISLNYTYKKGQNFLGALNTNIAKDSEWWIPYTVTDPGDDGKLGTGDEQDLTVFMLRKDAPSNFIQTNNIDEGWRKYWGLTFLIAKRMSNGWMFNGSVVFSKAYGNFPHGYLTYRGNQNFWDPNVDINREGRLEYDRPLIVKLMSSVELPYKFMLSGYFRHYAGAHFERQVTVYFPNTIDGYQPRSSSVTVNAEPEGNRDHESTTTMDLRLEKLFEFGKFHVGIWVDVFNLFGHSYFSWSQSRLVGGYIYADGSFARYSRYGQPSAVYGTREFAFGARIRF